MKYKGISTDTRLKQCRSDSVKREQALLTPEEARRYEMFSNQETIKAAQYNPVACTVQRKNFVLNEVESIIKSNKE